MGTKVSQKRIDQYVSAAGHGDLDLVQKALKGGVPVDAVTTQGFWALYLACENGHIEIIQALLDAGADVNKYGFGHDSLVKIPTVLHAAVDMAHVATIELLLEAGANPRTVDDINATCAHRLLRLSSKFLSQPAGDVALLRLVEKMLDAGIPVNQQQRSGIKLCHLGMANDAPLPVLELLLKRGTLLQGSDGSSLLHYAVFNEKLESVRLLLRNGVDPNSLDDSERNALWKSNSVEIDQLLLKAGALVNQVDIAGWTVLGERLRNVAPDSSVPEKIEVLISAGANIDLKPFRATLTPRKQIEDGGFDAIAAMVRARDAREAIRTTISASLVASPKRP